MSQTDSIADLLTCVRNASRARLEKTDVPDSRMGRAIIEILKREGFIQNYRVIDGHPRATLRIYLRYTKARRPVLTQLQRVSTPGLRQYVGKDELRPILGGMGLSILSTPRGVVTDAEAKAHGVGGELLCRGW